MMRRHSPSWVGLLPLLCLIYLFAIADGAGPIPLGRRGGIIGQVQPLLPRQLALTANTDLSNCLFKEGVAFVDSERNDTATYWEASQSDNVRFHFHPLAVAYPKGAKQVSKAVNCARKHGNIQVAARSGGHSFAGFGSGGQDGALIIDLKNLNHTISDSAHELAHIGPATRLGDVVKELWADGQRGMPHGTCPTVGTGGHALCGGFGPTSRKWGMAADNIIEAEIVLADGSIVHTSQHENEELWWAIRGSGSFFGIVTQFTFKTYDASSPMTFMEYKWTASLKSLEDTVKLMEGVQAFATKGSMPAELGWHIQAQKRNNNDPPGGTLAMHMRGMYIGDKAKYQANVATLLWKEVHIQPDEIKEDEVTYLQMMEDWDDFGKEGDKLDTLAERLQRNNFLSRTSLSMSQRGFSQEGFSQVMSTLWNRAVAESEGKIDLSGNQFYSWNVYFEMFGGSNARHRDSDLVSTSSMVNRDALWLIQTSVGSFWDADLPHAAHNFIEEIESSLATAFKKDKLEKRSYSCYADITLETWKQSYYAEAVPRLTALKTKLDPTNLFRNPQSLIDTPPASSEGKLHIQSEGYANVHPLP